jgi:DNA-binding NarL/FixJ family response regulator
LTERHRSAGPRFGRRVRAVIDGNVRRRPGLEQPQRRLTRNQLGVVRLLVAGLNPMEIAQRRGRSLSATYELLIRICERWNLAHWTEIAPAARRNGTVDPSDTD